MSHLLTRPSFACLDEAPCAVVSIVKNQHGFGWFAEISGHDFRSDRMYRLTRRGAENAARVLAREHARYEHPPAAGPRWADDDGPRAGCAWGLLVVAVMAVLLVAAVAAALIP